jgi:hypothetical protein
MGKSRFEGMEIAIREQSKIAESGIQDKIQIDTLKMNIESIDNETLQKIEEIKNTPVNKDILKRQAQNDFNTHKTNNQREYDSLLQQATHNINQASLDAEQKYKQAQIDIANKKAQLEMLTATAKEQKEQLDLDAQQEFDVAMASIDNVEKTIQLRIQKVEMEAQKRKKEFELKLRALEAKNNIIEEQKDGWKRFYKDVVEISKQPDT